MVLLVQGILRPEVVERKGSKNEMPIRCSVFFSIFSPFQQPLSGHFGPYLHCSQAPFGTRLAGDILSPCGIAGSGAGSWSIGAEGVCASATVLEPGSLKVTIGTPGAGPRAAPETVLNPTLPFIPPCTAS